MSDWLDDDGEPLGDWVPCTADEYVHTLDVVLDAEKTVFASRTEVGEQRDGVWFNRVMHTEWGRKGDATPLVRCHSDWDSFGEHTHTDYRFVLRSAARTPTSQEATA